METTVAYLAELVGGEVEGDSDLCVAGAATVEEAEPGDIVLAENVRFFERAVKSDAACIVAGCGVGVSRGGKSVIRAAEASEAFVKILEHLGGKELLPPVGVGAGAVIGRDVSLGENVAIGPNCCIGAGASLGDECVLFCSVSIGEKAQIGDRAKIYPGVTIYPNCRIGKRVILHAGVVIGADGFGYKPGEKGLMKLPHLGTVEIGDDVEIGANSTVDRAKTGATVIGSGTKIDNLVHVAHNVKIGANCVIVALSGVAGSVDIGDNVTLAAQTGVKDHVRIGDGSVVAARAGVIGDVQEGSTVSGFPARDHRVEKRAEAARLRLPEFMQRLRALEKELKKLRGGRKGENGDPQR